ncbi:MAG: ABC transporter ATP-binding protein [Candidatus Thorarchaeota archaeon]|nr:MAG: ABC transporter ATP-binding protein [Candidatus Thorarchaeota archaeon]
MVMVKISEVSKRYGEVVALSRFDMTVKRGSISGFVGPNGAGKSTTIRIITGLAKPDGGSAWIFGKNPYDNREVKERIGFVSEHNDLYSWATVWETVKMFARLMNPEKKVVDDQVKEAIGLVAMTKFRERKVSTLSKGMRQRTKIATALVHRPEFLVLDEPLGGLDPLGRRTVMNLLRRLNKEDGVSVLISSHVLEELEELVDRVTLIHRGQTLAEGSPKRIRGLLYQYPHEIVFKAQNDHAREIASGLIEIDGLVRALHVTESEKELTEFRVMTPKPEEFYDELTKIAVKTKSPILSLDTISESVERLFEYLVTGV